MALLDRLPFRKKKTPPTPPPSKTKERIVAASSLTLGRMYPPRVERFMNDLDATERWWPILLPLLAWIGWSTYRAERRKLLDAYIRTHFMTKDE